MMVTVMLVTPCNLHGPQTQTVSNIRHQHQGYPNDVSLSHPQFNKYQFV